MDKSLTITIAGVPASGKTLLAKFIIDSLVSEGVISRHDVVYYDVTGPEENIKLSPDTKKLAKAIKALKKEEGPAQEHTYSTTLKIPQVLWDGEQFVRSMLNAIVVEVVDQTVWADKIEIAIERLPDADNA